jgi:hypothetical protein
MKYGICTNHEFKTMIGSVYVLENLNDISYIVKEGNCDAVKKEAITLISKDEYEFIRSCQNEVLKNIDKFSEDAKEYYGQLFELRNRLGEN